MNTPEYLKKPEYVLELVPLNTIGALIKVEGDEELEKLAAQAANAMLRLRDKLKGRKIRDRHA